MAVMLGGLLLTAGCARTSEDSGGAGGATTTATATVSTTSVAGGDPGGDPGVEDQGLGAVRATRDVTAPMPTAPTIRWTTGEPIGLPGLLRSDVAVGLGHAGGAGSPVIDASTGRVTARLAGGSTPVHCDAIPDALVCVRDGSDRVEWVSVTDGSVRSSVTVTGASLVRAAGDALYVLARPSGGAVVTRLDRSGVVRWTSPSLSVRPGTSRDATVTAADLRVHDDTVWLVGLATETGQVPAFEAGSGRVKSATGPGYVTVAGDRAVPMADLDLIAGRLFGAGHGDVAGRVVTDLPADRHADFVVTVRDVRAGGPYPTSVIGVADRPGVTWWQANESPLAYCGGLLMTWRLIDQSRHVVAYDAATGVQRWTAPIERGPVGTAACDGSRVLVPRLKGVTAVNLVDGTPAWNLDLPTISMPTLSGVGACSTPGTRTRCA